MCNGILRHDLIKKRTRLLWQQKLFTTGSVLDSWLQQDGAPAHYALRVREFLDEVLPQRWIGRGSLHLPAAIEWPPRSPGLTSCDNSLWGIIKQKVLKQRYQTVEELKQAVREAFREITPPILRKISHRAWRRIIVYRDNDGAHTDILDH